MLASTVAGGGVGAAWRTVASRGDVRFEPEAILRIIREYTSESGVAQLHARLAKVCRRRSPAVITSADVPAILEGGGCADLLPLVVRDAIKVERARLAADSKGDLKSTNSWIEWLEQLPWNKRNDAPIDLARTREVLDAAQAGLADAKARIIEYLAVRKRNPRGAGAALCFLGPPGVGKTSLAQAVARALGREYVKLPCGGLHDDTDLRGHNRTWYKAQPGSILRELRHVGYRDPVFVLDEVDKIGPAPAAVLLEALDPEQQGRFRDSFVELRFDEPRAVRSRAAAGGSTTYSPRSRRSTRSSGVLPALGCGIVAECPELPDEHGWVEADGVGDLDELHDVQPSLAALVLGDEGLRPVEPRGQGLLREVGLEASSLHPTSEEDASGSEARPRHASLERCRLGSPLRDTGAVSGLQKA